MPCGEHHLRWDTGCTGGKVPSGQRQNLIVKFSRTQYKTHKGLYIEMTELVRIQEEDFSLEDEVRRLRALSKRVGAVVTFLGTARDFSDDKDVSAIEFEQYAGMAKKALTTLREEANKRFDIIETSIIHRINTIRPGEQIVLVVVASEHRKAAFEACQWCIDTLKETAPIWKKEITPEGDAWVVPHP